MNISLVTGFVVGGLFLLSIMALNRNMMLHSAESTVHIVNQYQSDVLFHQLEHDLSRIGYGFPNGSQPVGIQQITDKMIKFRSDVTDEGVDEVLWIFTGNPANQTPNPNDKILRRTGSVGAGTEGNHQIQYAIIDFKLTAYRDTEGMEEAITTDQVRSILVEIAYESPSPVKLRNQQNDEYSRAYWRKLIVPKNLQFNRF